tara:strand:+ start:3153 stop:3356 length:204 start_codon:yes stop_codon:yes gene_type:complete
MMFIGNKMEEKNQKHKQQDLTELNSDGNRERGSEGEDLSDIELTKEEEEQLKKKLEKLRQQDPFIYR